MRTYHLDSFKRGWIVGDFLPSILRTEQFEVAILRLNKGEDTKDHYHAKSAEINVVVSGMIEVNGYRFSDGDIFVLDPFEVSVSKVHWDTTIVVVKAPSIPGDKHEV